MRGNGQGVRYRRPEEACGNAGDAHPVGSHGVAWEQTPRELWGRRPRIGLRCCEATPKKPDRTLGRRCGKELAFVHLLSSLPVVPTDFEPVCPSCPRIDGGTHYRQDISGPPCLLGCCCLPGLFACRTAEVWLRNRLDEPADTSSPFSPPSRRHLHSQGTLASSCRNLTHKKAVVCPPSLVGQGSYRPIRRAGVHKGSPG